MNKDRVRTLVVLVYCFALITLSLFAETSVSTASYTALANYRTAIRCYQQSRDYIEKSQWTNAFSQSELGLVYDDSISDLWFVNAYAGQRLGKSPAEVLPSIKKAVEQDKWIDYNKDGALLLYAELLSHTGESQRALEYLEDGRIYPSSSREYLKILCNYRIGTPESYERARQLVSDASRLYPDDMRFVQVFFKYEVNYDLSYSFEAESLGEKLAEGFEEVQIAYANTISQNTSNGEFVPVKLGQGTYIDRFGPEVGMAEKIAEVDPEKRVVIIKYAYGGTTLNNEWRSPSSGNTGRLYTGAVEYIIQQLETLEAMDLYPIVKAICWMQGESDASGLNYNQYEMLEENFVKDLRNDLAYYKPIDAEIGFVDAGISDLTAWTQYKVINQAKMNLSEKDDYHDYIDTISAGLKYNAEPVGNPDPYHYDSKYMIQLGHLFAEVLLARYIEQ